MTSHFFNARNENQIAAINEALTKVPYSVSPSGVLCLSYPSGKRFKIMQVVRATSKLKNVYDPSMPYMHCDDANLDGKLLIMPVRNQLHFACNGIKIPVGCRKYFNSYEDARAALDFWIAIVNNSVTSYSLDNYVIVAC